jgi:hypothetical protein
MKNLLLFLLLLAYGVTITNAQTWIWAKQAGGSNVELGASVCTDSSGNVYATGYFLSASITFGTYTLTNNGVQNLFVVKYDNDGAVLWAKSFGGTIGEEGKSICTDPDGNVYITGIISSPTVDFGSGVICTNSISPHNNMLLLKLNSSGDPLWVQTTFADNSGIEGNTVATDNSGNVYVAGIFGLFFAQFGPGVNDTLNFNGTDNSFIVKYDPSGTLLFYKRIPGYLAGASMIGGPSSIIVDNSENIYITGGFDGGITNTNDIYVTKLDASGLQDWRQNFGGTDADYSNSLTLDDQGNIYFTGDFISPSISFGGTSLTNASTPNDPNRYAAKLSNTGTPVWAKRLTNGNSSASGITIDINNNLYLVGYGVDTVIATIPFSYPDVIVMKLNPANGNTVWSKVAGDGFIGLVDFPTSIDSDNSGNLFITGHFSGTVSAFGSTVLSTSGMTDIFVAKLNTGPSNVEEINLADNVSVHPNPANIKTVIKLNKAKLLGSTFVAYDITGCEVARLKLNQYETSLPKNNLSSGIYMFQIISDDNSLIGQGKLIFE